MLVVSCIQFRKNVLHNGMPTHFHQKWMSLYQTYPSWRVCSDSDIDSFLKLHEFSEGD